MIWEDGVPPVSAIYRDRSGLVKVKNQSLFPWQCGFSYSGAVFTKCRREVE
jgi:hypothetical protein